MGRSREPGRARGGRRCDRPGRPRRTAAAMTYNVVRIDEIEPVPYLGSNLIPVRHTLGVRPAGTNAWIADEGGQLIPPHAEDSGNEELYVVLRGRATFTVGGETGDAPAGSLVFVPPEVERTATAEEQGTIVLAVGATIGKPFEGGAWDTFAVADAHHRAHASGRSSIALWRTARCVGAPLQRRVLGSARRKCG